MPYPEAHSFGQALLWSVVFGVVGIALTVAGFKIFDLLTPIKVETELAEKQNMAVAIVVAAMIIGVAIVVSSAIG
jgi:putative membrane protein